MFKTTKVIAMLLCASVAAPAFAQSDVDAGFKEHLIFIQSDGYFPETSYVKPGDRARFVNTSDQSHEVISVDDSWGTGPIAVGSEVILVIEDNMNMGFHNKADAEETGQITFEDPPLD